MSPLLFLVAAQASASPVVVPGGQYLLPGPHQNLLRSLVLPYYPLYPFTNWKLITQDVVIDIDVDYTCLKEVAAHGIYNANYMYLICPKLPN